MLISNQCAMEQADQLREQIKWAVGGRYTEVKSMVLEANWKKSGGSSGRKRKIGGFHGGDVKIKEVLMAIL